VLIEVPARQPDGIARHAITVVLDRKVVSAMLFAARDDARFNRRERVDNASRREVFPPPGVPPDLRAVTDAIFDFVGEASPEYFALEELYLQAELLPDLRNHFANRCKPAASRNERAT
jgi:hypothetical protein